MMINKLKVNIIGTGNMAHFWCYHLLQHQFEVSIWGRNTERSKQIANQYNIQQTIDLNTIPDDSDQLCILAVADRAIATISGLLNFEKTIVIHCAGTLSVNQINDSISNKGVLWPIYSINKTSYTTKHKIPFAVEGSSTIMTQLLQELIEHIGFKATMLTHNQRKQLHVAAVCSNNFVNHILALTQEFCIESNIPFELLHPITQQTIALNETNNFKELQTGPAIRNDIETILSHESILKQHSELLKIYKILTESIANTRISGNK
jgi:predicted short-subunit dehydrogenase-like oxidoreductase (DUF2520 family)